MPEPSTTDAAPLRTLFCVTSMPVGGAETLLVNLIRRLDRSKIAPEICCLKQPGPLGDEMAAEVPVHSGLIHHKLDVLVLNRMTRLLRERQIDAVVTVGAGDKMFWGRLAAKRAGVPVVCSALHSTGWPDGVGRLNRLLTPLTDAFIAVAAPHGRHLIEGEKFPASKVVVIPNGVDTARFAPGAETNQLRSELGIPATSPVGIIVAALRPEKNHELYLEVAARVTKQIPEAVFLVVGDGPQRVQLKERAEQLELGDSVRFLGTRSDIPSLLNLADVNVLTSHNEANPVSILEAMSTGTPTVASNVGSVSESVVEGKTGYLAPAGDAEVLSERVLTLMNTPLLRQELGAAARQMVESRWSLEVMVEGYEQLLWRIYTEKTGIHAPSATEAPAEPCVAV
ncbi:glycosyltransferase [Aeoliella mucimassa]|uniref:Glycosyltransferase EpsF n=1 Tax=Aeoliella mucimassa TaxID=2527972 RepID=A0A518ANZ4_9BACT|nr:glycosyltransferase [Aeoliella mucimassa]QDU56445.1 Putative glycosyltransferase EpsF [Aeoliella mucimassa]